MRRKRWAVHVAVVALAALARPLAAETPYVFQQGGLEGPRRSALEAQTTAGTRETGPLGQRGVEQSLRLRLRIAEETTVAAFGGALWQPAAPELRPGAIGAEVVQRVLAQERAGVDVHLAAGGYRDVTGVFVPRARALAGRSWGRLHTQASGLLEVPLAAGRDRADLVLGVAAAWQVTAATAVGVEALGEDIEALWNPAEAEGGARVLAGPNLAVQFGAVAVRGSVGATAWWPRAGAASAGAQLGALGRVQVGWRF